MRSHDPKSNFPKELCLHREIETLRPMGLHSPTVQGSARPSIKGLCNHTRFRPPAVPLRLLRFSEERGPPTPALNFDPTELSSPFPSRRPNSITRSRTPSADLILPQPPAAGCHSGLASFLSGAIHRNSASETAFAIKWNPSPCHRRKPLATIALWKESFLLGRQQQNKNLLNCNVRRCPNASRIILTLILRRNLHLHPSRIKGQVIQTPTQRIRFPLQLQDFQVPALRA